MKKSLAFLALAAASFAALAMPPTPVGFTDDLDAARVQAAASGRHVFAVFSGSDWCSWCMRLEREVLSKPSFRAAVTNDLVLAFVDSPQDVDMLSPKARRANPLLVRKYGIRGFPTALILDADGKALASTGYRRGGPAAYAVHLKELVAGLGPAPKKPESPRIVAHRGGRAEYDDNALGAFRQSLAYGVTAFETDIRATADGELVLMHDADVARTTTGTGLVSKISFADFRKLKMKKCGEPAPSLADLVDVFAGNPRAWVQFEMKDCSPLTPEAYCRKLHDAVAAKMLPGAASFISFNPQLVAAMRKVDPEADVGLLFSKVLGDEEIKATLAVGASAVLPRTTRGAGTNTTAEAVAKAHAAGLKVYGWMSGSGKDHAAAREVGFDSVTTDDPVLMLSSVAVADAKRANPALNTALVPAAKLQWDGYDWFRRHAKVMAEKAAIDPEIVFVGDSITHFWAGHESVGRMDDPATLPRWKKAFGKWRTLNLGYGWDRTGNVFKRLDLGELDGVDPKLIVVHVGGNNFSTTVNYAGNTPEEVAAADLALVKRLHEMKPRAHLAVMAIFPFGMKPGDWHRAKIPVANAILAKSLAGLDYVTFIDVTAKQIGPDGIYPVELAKDHVHPTDAGYDIWAAALTPTIDRVCGKR